MLCEGLLSIRKERKLLRESRQNLKNALDELNSEGGIQLSMSGDVGPHQSNSSREHARNAELIGIAKSFGPQVAISHSANLLALAKKEPGHIIQELSQELPRFDLDHETWPFFVSPTDDSDGRFSSQMHLGIYGTTAPVAVMLYTNAIYYYNNIASEMADETAISAAIPIWQREFGNGAEFGIKSFEKGIELRPGLLGRSRMTGLAITVIRPQSQKANTMAYLFILKKLAHFIRQKNIENNPKFEDGYLNKAKLEKWASEAAAPGASLKPGY